MYGENEALVGKTVERLTRREKDLFRFHLTDGTAVTWEAVGDCCSHSWVEHVSGVAFLIGGTVRAVESTNIGEESNEEHECLQKYSYKITTDKGVCEFELRNSSNGYYGGSLDEAAYDGGTEALPIAVTADL